MMMEEIMLLLKKKEMFPTAHFNFVGFLISPTSIEGRRFDNRERTGIIH
jgi:hypothetical protein